MPVENPNILELLKAMEMYELWMAELYKAAGDFWEEDIEFFKGMESGEVKHFNFIKMMADIYKDNPDDFEIGRPIKVPAISSMIENIKSEVHRLKTGELSKPKFLYMARLLEETILERKYNEVLKTSIIEYQKLVKEIVADTYIHKNQLEDRIGELKYETSVVRKPTKPD